VRPAGREGEAAAEDQRQVLGAAQVEMLTDHLLEELTTV